ncbi:MAG: tetratricopeptide repeat protein [Pseudomonadota bacterium]
MPVNSVGIRRLSACATALAAALAVLAPAAPVAAQGIAGAYLAAEHAARTGDLDAAADYYAKALARDVENTALMSRAMGHQLASGQLPQAVAMARRLQVVAPGQHVAVLVLAADELRREEPARALTLLDSEAAAGPFVGRIIAAWAEFQAGRPDDGLAVLASLEEDRTGGPAGALLAAYHTGLMEAALGDEVDAADALARAAERAGTPSARLARMQATTLARLGRTEEALAVLDSTLSRTLTDPRLEALRAALAAGETPPAVISTGAEGAAEALYGVSRYLMRGPNQLIGLSYARLATYLVPDLVEAHLLIADTLTAEEQYALAIAAYEAVPEDAPEVLSARIGRADALDGLGKLDDAVASLRALVTRHPGALDAHTALGDLLRRNERFAEAATAYDGAVALIETPENRHWPLFYQRGICYERSKQWPKAEADFRKALELEPDQPLVLNYLGYSWVDMGMNLDEAQNMIEKAVQQRPEDGYIVDSLGWVFYRLGNFEEAVVHLGRAVELRPVDPIINDHYGDALWMVGRRIEAEFQWQRALSFDPEEDEAERIRRKLDVGLDVVQEEEAATGTPAVIGRTEEPKGENDGG